MKQIKRNLSTFWKFERLFLDSGDREETSITGGLPKGSGDSDHIHSKLSITEKRRSKSKYLTWISVILRFVKKTIMPNPVKSLAYVNSYSSSSPRTVKSPSNSIRYNCRKICRWSRKPKTIGNWKKGCISLSDHNNSIIYKVFKDFTNHRKKTNREVVFSFRPFPNIL